MKNKIALLVIAIIVIITALFIYNNYKKLSQKNSENSQPTVETQPAKKEAEIPDDIKKIMNNNATGSVISIDQKAMTLAIDTGKTYNLTNESYVLQVADGKIENKSLTDIKAGTKIYVQFEPETNNALTITILK